MIRTRWIEFFESDTGPLSMTRLLCFLSFFPASWVVVQVQNADTLGWYLGAFVLGYVGGKATDAYSTRTTFKPEPANVTINQPEKVNVAGDAK